MHGREGNGSSTTCVYVQRDSTSHHPDSRLDRPSRSLQTVEDSSIYDEVTEDQYKTIVKGRQQRDDFVVDDGVDGYMDNGMDDFGEDEAGSEEEERERSKKKKGMLAYKLFQCFECALTSVQRKEEGDRHCQREAQSPPSSPPCAHYQ